MIKILFLSANPLGTLPLRFDWEVRSINEKLRQTELRDKVEIQHEWAVRVTDIQGHLLKHKPNIVHFSGHGSPLSEIILEDQSGEIHPISSRSLSRLFFVLKDEIKCVVLNACYTKELAQTIAENIDCVIGMSKAITDTAATSFATAFYQALGYNKNFKTGFDLACTQIDLENIDEHETPKIFLKRELERTTPFPLDQELDDKKLAFVNIAIDNTNPYWVESKVYLNEEIDPNVRKETFGRSCAQYFHWCKENAAPSFDITLMNTASTPILLTEVGVKIVSVRHLTYFYGTGPQAIKIKKEDAYSVKMPDLRPIIRNNLDKNPFMTFYGSSVIDINQVVLTKLPDPILLEASAPYRYGLFLDDYEKNMPNNSALRLCVYTNRGLEKSHEMHLALG